MKIIVAASHSVPHAESSIRSIGILVGTRVFMVCGTIGTSKRNVSHLDVVKVQKIQAYEEGHVTLQAVHSLILPYLTVCTWTRF